MSPARMLRRLAPRDPRVTAPRRLLPALIPVALAGLVVSVAYVAHRRGVENGAALAVEALDRVTATNAEIAGLQVLTASLSAARRVAEGKAAVAWALVESAEVERADVLASVRAPMSPDVRARRVRRALALAAPDEAPTPNAPLVSPLVLDGVPGMFVEAKAFDVLHAALELRPVLERQVVALTKTATTERARADLAVRELAITAQERDVLRIAWVAAEGDAADLRESVASVVPWWSWVVLGVAAGAAAGYAIAASAGDVTVVR